jgi:hypothetical protein
MAAVPIIAELSRRFIAAEDIPRWFYRGSLEFLERTSAEQIHAFRLLLRETGQIQSTSDSVTISSGAGPKPNQALPSGEPAAAIEISPIADAARFFSMLKRAGLAFESNAWGHSGSPNIVVITHQVLGWLRAAFVDSAS